MRKKALWSKSVGERGNRVRVYEPRANAPLMISVFENGRERRVSLGHRDRKRAVSQAYEVHAKRRAGDLGQLPDLTLEALAARYLRSQAHLDKKARTQRDDERRLSRVISFLGPSRLVRSLSESDVRRFTRARVAGDSSLPGVVPGRPVKQRAVEADLVALVTALNWATKERGPSGARLLQENPLYGVKLAKEKNPTRPVMPHDVYLAVLEVASAVHPLLRLALVIAEGSGRRLGAIRLLRWDDIDLASKSIHWRAASDKKGYSTRVPMNESMLAELHAAAQTRCGPWVFPAPLDPSKPCDRHLFDNWLRRAYVRAGHVPLRGGLWHPIRRKWATERKNYPVSDVAAAGGWRDTQTLLASYQRPDDETIRTVVLEPRLRVLSQTR